MKWYYKLSIGVIIALIAYLIGNLIPIEYLKPNIETSSINSSEFYSLVISSISAFVTFLAVMVALFKDDLRKYWHYSKFEIKFADSTKISEKLEIDDKETTSETGSRHYKAEKYESTIIIENIGNKPAKNCEIYLERLMFKNDEFSENQNIKIKSSSLKWNSEEEKRIHIPPGGKKTIVLIELLEPKKQSLPDGKERPSIPELRIGGNLNPKEFSKGKWESHFIVYSDDSRPKSFIIKLDWNGKWEQRFSEIRKCLNINLID